MTLSCIRFWDTCSGGLFSVKYLFIAENNLFNLGMVTGQGEGKLRIQTF